MAAVRFSPGSGQLLLGSYHAWLEFSFECAGKERGSKNKNAAEISGARCNTEIRFSAT